MSVAPSKPPSYVTDPKKLLSLFRDTQKKITEAKNRAVAVASVANSQKKPTVQAPSIIDNFSSWINDTAKNVGKAITVGLDDIQDFGESLFKDFSAFLEGQVEGLGRSIDDISSGIGISIDSLGEGINNAVADAKSFLDNSLEDIGSSVSALPSLLSETVANSATEIVSRLNSLGAGIVESVTDGIADSQKFIGSAIDKTIKATNELADSMSENLDKSIKQIQKNAEQVLDTISDAFNDSILALTLGFSAINKTLLEVFTFDADKLIRSVIELRAKSEDLARQWSIIK